MLSTEDVLTSPAYYPTRIDTAAGTIRFVRMSAETYRRSVFMDHRLIRIDKESFAIRIDDLLLAGKRSYENAPTHFILHTTFCCSTLLARYFELVPRCLVLKEPGILTQLALMPEAGSDAWRALSLLVLRLLRRPFDPEGFVVVKPHEPFNFMGKLLLESDPLATLSFVSTPLKEFLLSVLKSEDRRAWVVKRVRQQAHTVASYPLLANIDAASLRVPEAIACLWLRNQAIQRDLSISYATRMVALDGNLISNAPSDALCRILPLLAGALDPASIGSLVAEPSMQTYSKDSSKPYSATARELELYELSQQWGAETAAGMRWAYEVAGYAES